MAINSEWARPTAGPDRWRAKLRSVSARPWRRPDLFLCSIFINLLSLALPLALLQVYDRIVPNDAHTTLALLVAGVGCALFLEGFLRIARAYLTGWIGARFEHLAGVATIEQMFQMDLEEIEREGSGAHLERFRSLNIVKEFYSGQAIQNLLDLPFAFLFLGLIGYLGGIIVAIPIGLILLYMAAGIFAGIPLRRAVRNRRTRDDRRFNFIVEVLNGIHTVKSMGMEALMLRRYERLQERTGSADRAIFLRDSSMQAIGTLVSQLGIIGVVGFGCLLVLDGLLTIGAMAACTMLASRAIQPIQRVMSVWTRYQSYTVARQQLGEVLDRAAPRRAQAELPPVDGEFEFQDVSFGYDETGSDILNGVGFRIDPGETVAITGNSGCGKTSLLWLIMGVLRPTAGKILIDGYDLAEFAPQSVARQFGYLPQHGKLVQGTILENITMFRPELTTEAFRIAGMLGLEADIAMLPTGYDTSVGEGAVGTLPPGVSQRVAIARALVDRPPIVLFDEANVEMSPAGESFVKTTLTWLKGGCTMVLATRSPSILKLADRTYELGGGDIVPHDPQLAALVHQL